jgi:hypothetical protein
MLILAFAFAFLFASTWVVVMTISLPVTDGAYGQMPFEDPLVFEIMSIFAIFAGVITSPVFYYALRNRRFPHALFVFSGIVIIAIIVTTFINPLLGLIGSFAAYAVGIVITRKVTAPISAAGSCQSCGYDLRGTPEGRACPECGAIEASSSSANSTV